VPTVVLASASPARAATLRAAGINPLIKVANLDETALLAQTAQHTPLTVCQSVQVLAQAKAQAVAASHPEAGDVVIGCDSMLEFEGEGLGKPGNPDEARQRWRSMRGRQGVLHSGHFLIARNGRTTHGVASTTVHFAHVDDAEIDAYIATGEPLNVAGAFTIDGRGGAFITATEGDHHAVVGISLPLLRTLMAELGFFWPDLWAKDKGTFVHS